MVSGLNGTLIYARVFMYVLHFAVQGGLCRELSGHMDLSPSNRLELGTEWNSSVQLLSLVVAYILSQWLHMDSLLSITVVFPMT